MLGQRCLRSLQLWHLSNFFGLLLAVTLLTTHCPLLLSWPKPPTMECKIRRLPDSPLPRFLIAMMATYPAFIPLTISYFHNKRLAIEEEECINTFCLSHCYHAGYAYGTDSLNFQYFIVFIVPALTANRFNPSEIPFNIPHSRWIIADLVDRQPID